MKKRIYLFLSAVLAAMLMLAGCSGGGGEEASGELTFKQALDRPGVHVWYDVPSPSDGRFAKVNAAFIFEDGKVKYYDTADIEKDIPNALGTLEDYYALSEDDAAALVREKYRNGYEAYYALLQNYITKIKEDKEQGLNYPEPEEQERALQETYETLTAQPLPEKEPQEFSLVMTLDKTGNSVFTEEIHTNIQYDRYYKGYLGIAASGYELYSVYEAESLDTYFPVQTPVDNVEVYDTWYGGYEADYYDIYGKGSLHYLVTKCKEDTIFTLDPVGTEGIEMIE